MKNIVLASGSPRRKELFDILGYDYIVDVSNVSETYDDNMSIEEIVSTLAKRKATNVALRHNDKIVIGFDTLVVFGEKILGKPVDENDAFKMLDTLSGNTHKVLTGCCIINGKNIITFFESALVKFNKITDEEIKEYISTKEPMDKAGAYAIQGIASKFVEGVYGDYYSVIGVPISRIYQELKAMDS